MKIKNFIDQIRLNISWKLRLEKMEPLVTALKIGATVLDIGIWSRFPEPNPTENWLEKQTILTGTLVAVGLENMSEFKNKYPRVLCVQADGCALPFKDEAVDRAISNAVLEHVPQPAQKNFVNEIARVSRTESILAVPDRWCPVEIHSRIPFIHWFPNWRSLFRVLGKGYWGAKDNLSTIFTQRSLDSLLQSNKRSGSWKISRQTFWGIPVSLIATYSPRKSR